MSSYRRDDKAFRARMGSITSAQLSEQVVGVTDYPRTPKQARPLRDTVAIAFLVGLVLVGFSVAVRILAPIIHLIVWGSW